MKKSEALISIFIGLFLFSLSFSLATTNCFAFNDLNNCIQPGFGASGNTTIYQNITNNYINQTINTTNNITTYITNNIFDQSLNTTDDVNFNSVTANNFYGSLDASYILNAPWITDANTSGLIQDYYSILNGTGLIINWSNVISSSAGNPFDQVLNTTSAPKFLNLTITGNISMLTSDESCIFSANGLGHICFDDVGGLHVGYHNVTTGNPTHTVYTGGAIQQIVNGLEIGIWNSSGLMVNNSANISTDGFFKGDGRYLINVPTINSSYYLVSNPLGFYNSSNFLISDYFTKSQINSFNYFNLTTDGYIYNSGQTVLANLTAFDARYANTGLNYFLFNDTQSGQYKIMNTTAPNSTAPAKDIVISGITDGQVLASWINPNTNLTTISTGIGYFHSHVTKTAGLNTLAVKAEFYLNMTNGTEQLIATSGTSDQLVSGVMTTPILFVSFSDSTISVTDRLVVKLVAVVTGATTAPTADIMIENGTQARISFPTVSSTISFNEVDPIFKLYLGNGTLNTTALAYVNSSGLILNWTNQQDNNKSGLIKDWNFTGFIKDWNSTGFIKDWNMSGYIQNWSNVITSSGGGIQNGSSAYLSRLNITTDSIYIRGIDPLGGDNGIYANVTGGTGVYGNGLYGVQGSGSSIGVKAFGSNYGVFSTSSSTGAGFFTQSALYGLSAGGLNYAIITQAGAGDVFIQGRLNVSGDINATANVYDNGNRVCTASNGICPGGAGGGRTLINQSILGANSTIIFVNYTQGTYEYIEYEIFINQSSGNAVPQLRFNGNLGSTYAWSKLVAATSTTGASQTNCNLTTTASNLRHTFDLQQLEGSLTIEPRVVSWQGQTTGATVATAPLMITGTCTWYGNANITSVEIKNMPVAVTFGKNSFIKVYGS